MRYYPRFPEVIPHSRVDWSRVTHPFATLLMDCSTFAFDLHVLGTPPALILSQDQTLMLNSPPLPHQTARFRLPPRSAEDNCLTRGRFIGSALFNPYVCRSRHQP